MDLELQLLINGGGLSERKTDDAWGFEALTRLSGSSWGPGGEERIGFRAWLGSLLGSSPLFWAF